MFTKNVRKETECVAMAMDSQGWKKRQSFIFAQSHTTTFTLLCVALSDPVSLALFIYWSWHETLIVM